MNKNVIGIVLAFVVLAGLWYFLDARNSSELDSVGSSSSYAQKFSVVEDTRSETVSTTSNKIISMHKVKIETNKGVIVFETYDNDAPNTVKNFITLAQKNFYDGVIFHRVIRNFMIQGGDPTGTGMGGPGYKFADELDPNTPSAKMGYKRGTLAMANSGPNTNGSQFFIMHADYPLPLSYTIFGKVISGMEVVDAIATAPVDGDDRPVSEVKMLKVTVEEIK